MPDAPAGAPEHEEQATYQDENGFILPRAWRSQLDAATNKFYFYNAETRETRWKAPGGREQPVPPPPPPQSPAKKASASLQVFSLLPSLTTSFFIIISNVSGRSLCFPMQHRAKYFN